MSDEPQRYNYTFYMIHRKGRNIIDIYDEEDGEHYIGSTRNFKNRIRCHQEHCNNPKIRHYNSRKYKHIRLNWGGFEECEFSTIETHNNLTKKEAFIHERWLIELYGSQLNSQNPIRTKEDDDLDDKLYREKNKDILNEKHRIWYSKNKEKSAERGKEYRNNNKEKEQLRHKKYAETHAEQLKKHREDTKDEKRAYDKKRREVKHDELLEQYKNRYHLKRQDAEWVEKERTRLREYAQIKRAKKKLEKEQNVFATQDCV